MNRLNQIIASVIINAISVMQNFPIVLVQTLLGPISFIILITFVSRGALLGVGILGGFIMIMAQSGIGLQGDLTHLKTDMRLQDMVVSSPTTASIYLIGMAVSELVYSIPALIVLTILAFFLLKLTLEAMLIIIIVMFLMFSFSIALGFMLSTMSSDIIESWGFSNILSIILTTLPPVYYTINLIPLPYRYLAYLSPTTYAAEIVQNASGFLSLNISMLFIDWIVLIALTVIILFIASKKSRWREV
jgi:ABC-2 type transport system permease protein